MVMAYARDDTLARRARTGHRLSHQAADTILTTTHGGSDAR